MSNDGPDRNVICIQPPLCFTTNNGQHLVEVFDKLLHEIECGACPDLVQKATGRSPSAVKPTELHIDPVITSGRLYTLSSDEEEGDDTESADNQSKRARFEDLD